MQISWLGASTAGAFMWWSEPWANRCTATGHGVISRTGLPDTPEAAARDSLWRARASARPTQRVAERRRHVATAPQKRRPPPGPRAGNIARDRSDRLWSRHGAARTAVADADLRGAFQPAGGEQAVPDEPVQGADGSERRVRPAHADRLRLRRSDGG